MQKKTLAIMAAGFGSRFGGLKQLHSFTSMHYSILDFSIYDAIQVGFNSIVFIVRDDILELFKQKYDNALPNHVSVEFVIQSIDTIPDAFKPIKRIKPWGTGQALLSLKDVVNSKFALINADDFYGRNAFALMHDHLFSHSQDNFLIGYPLDKTLSKNGTVSRGECFIEELNYLSHIIERKAIAQQKDGIIFSENNSVKTILGDTIVSMNFWGFTPNVFAIAEEEFHNFLRSYENDASEFYITSVVDAAISLEQVFRCLKTNSQWFGVTYKEDLEGVSKQIEELIDQGRYPKQLW